MNFTDEQVNHEKAGNDNNSDHYTLDVNGTPVRLRFNGTTDLNTRLANAFGNMLMTSER